MTREDLPEALVGPMDGAWLNFAKTGDEDGGRAPA
jgi:hypothetical protein